MIITQDFELQGVRDHLDAHATALPERIPRHWRPIMAAADAAVVVFVSLISLNGGSGSRIAAAIVTAALVCGVFWLCGYYRRSYAVHARDEAYYACAGVALAAVPTAIVLSSVAYIPLFSIVLALLFSALATSVLRVRLHLERHPNGCTPRAGISSISASAWHDREQQLYQLSKRLFDVSLAVLALLVFSPLMLAAAIAIRRENDGPILFRQERVGQNGRLFTMFKFRTMRTNAGDAWVKPGDERITKSGAWLRRTSIDELPQLFNVLRGEMSIVGPRPEMVSFAAEFAEVQRNYAQRHVVAPGITGWAQVYLERNLEPGDMPTVLPYDLFYVEHSSVLLDTAIVLKTASEVFFHRAV
jgi:lipopolysaccharide/colanic/teichoic acid biosynthesis glycosyltransferase